MRLENTGDKMTCHSSPDKILRIPTLLPEGKGQKEFIM